MAQVDIEMDDASLVVLLKELKYRMDGGYSKNDVLAYTNQKLHAEIDKAYAVKRDLLLQEMYQQMVVVYDKMKGENAKTGTK